MPSPTGHLAQLRTVDIGEHAYYLDYQDRLVVHMEAYW
jgi:superoxide dismutase